MSETPKKIEFIMMKHSAAEFVKANRVAFIVSAENYIDKFKLNSKIYNSLGLDDIDRRIYVVLGRERNPVETVHNSCILLRDVTYQRDRGPQRLL